MRPIGAGVPYLIRSRRPQGVMMEPFHSIKPLGCTVVGPGVIVKMEEEEEEGYDLRNGQNPGCAKIKCKVETEHREEMSIRRRPKSEARLSLHQHKIGHNANPEVEIKLEEDDQGYVMGDQQFEDRDSSPAASPDYLMVQVKEEEEDMSFEMNYQQHMEMVDRPETSSAREKDVRIHRLSTKMLINIDHLIQMVQERPELYDPKVPSYADRYKKRKAWDEICAILVPDWELCGDREKNMKVKEVQTRWRSLKDCFRRELTLQKKLERSGIPANRRRKYVHYEDLLFLEPTMKIRDTVINNTPITALREPADILPPVRFEQAAASPTMLPALPLPIHLLPPARDPPPAPILARKTKKKAANKNENEWERQLLSVMSTLRKKTEERIDPDEIFLKNLLPFVKKVPEDRKIDMQLGLMHVVKRFMEPVQKGTHAPSRNTPYIPPQPYEQHSATPPRRKSRHRPASPQPSFPVHEPSPAARSQPPSYNHSHAHEPYSSPSSSPSSVTRSPQNHRDSPYYFDL